MVNNKNNNNNSSNSLVFGQNRQKQLQTTQWFLVSSLYSPTMLGPIYLHLMARAPAVIGRNNIPLEPLSLVYHLLGAPKAWRLYLLTFCELPVFQARNLLLQSGLPQNILAQIWGLSDVDSDGRLSAEEFILAGHLCDMAAKVTTARDVIFLHLGS